MFFWRMDVFLTKCGHERGDFSVENWEDFCTKLLTNGEWGGEVEIMCFARTFQVNIHVHQITNYVPMGCPMNNIFYEEIFLSPLAV